MWRPFEEVRYLFVIDLPERNTSQWWVGVASFEANCHTEYSLYMMYKEILNNFQYVIKKQKAPTFKNEPNRMMFFF